ncbi:MAG: magnesium transporter [Alysiella sp.]|uniref:magnesium transporter n=1 Tax=Alysiella sp. TaxID=1872483 RepID=UPI0026DBF0C4|nr:magnesium transporter [Alysiella sp.]MDO4433769.1 magnesium transporter [Alysiella sp.]
MDKKRTFLIWLAMAVVFSLIAYLVGTTWWLSIIIGILAVALTVGLATGTMYWKQKKLIEHATKFNIDLKNGKIHPADLRRMYFSGGQARKDALLIASQAMRCSVQEAEKQLSQRVSKQAANQEMAKHQKPGKQGRGRPR